MDVLVTCDGAGCQEPGAAGSSVRSARLLLQLKGWKVAQHGRKDYCPSCWQQKQKERRKMDKRSRLKRLSDGKLFVPVLVAHWSDIVDMDRTESDSVKWVGDNQYVSANKGHVYALMEQV